MSRIICRDYPSLMIKTEDLSAVSFPNVEHFHFHVEREQVLSVDVTMRYNRKLIHIINVEPWESGDRMAAADTITVLGYNLSSWVTGYDIHAQVGEMDTVTLHLQYDPDKFKVVTA